MPDTNLPALPFDFLESMANALTTAARDNQTRASAFLRMDKTGHWTFGVDQEPVPEDQQFLVNPQGFQKGYVCWKENALEKLGDVVVPLNAAMPEPGEVPVGGRGWEQQFGIQVRGLKGPFDGREAVYRSSSYGGRKALTAFFQLCSVRLHTAHMNPKADDFVPVVTLGSDFYIHGKYGKLFEPEIKIVRWARFGALALPAAAAPKRPSVVEEEPVEPVARKRGRPARAR